MSNPTLQELLDGVRSGNRRATARAISLVENADPLGYAFLREVFPETGRSYAVGFTGPPGVGKSTLLSALVTLLRERELRLGVISVDPSSPFTQGALLGDRIRLVDHFLDPGVFIRSMGTRGHLGGLAQATLEAALVLDAAGSDILLLETVGTGQSEVEVRGLADTVVLVLMPGSGDAVQALKAGIMEIPDVIVVNKADQAPAAAILTDIRTTLALGELERMPALITTEALTGEGIDELWSEIEDHRAWLGTEGKLEPRRREHLAREVFAIAGAQARTHLEQAVVDDPELRRVLDAVQDRSLDPLSAVREILETVFRIDSDRC